ncbi:LuxR C-terminal-related transcriptional regulator [Mucilaginibacter auburnensis]|uniref:Regulatory LuxR family protein n=1 Tax=Mucilaginibacter auburnensis TaxID=1457233 RepID=A0A2H9VW72_9SPHI|nr:LuxR C-terminal-related transcriptional regulator [Mucilaginibacter auburnensis]PJJ85051.1 regulatory LuxR family protein [Mucilaginibacter auburnensis]
MKEPEFKQHQKFSVDLSRREMEILTLLAERFTNIEIADRLFTKKRSINGITKAYTMFVKSSIRMGRGCS